ncbi:Reverse transcriptase from transposon X-element protein [Rhizoctonia solani]|uniref:Reverse transcriptase from transposon X-element protein n=1 Tax=Rhizoctonia solani TaxID=456999 RepID=A0A8H8P2I0_9AGAM|nr:Reverse transcriptase from transposon X-element protein [Rhizoctonia solani]QRW22628.1 Reverse transcriptase from transposon X-element protein [Rhizoctonia solani]
MHQRAHGGSDLERPLSGRGMVGAARQHCGDTLVKLRRCSGHSGVQGNVLVDMEVIATRAADGHLAPHFLGDYCPRIKSSECKLELKAPNRQLGAQRWAPSVAGTKYAPKCPHISPAHFTTYTHGLRDREQLSCSDVLQVMYNSGSTSADCNK